MLTRKTVLQAKLEASYGVAPIMSVSDAILISNLTVSVDPTILERDVYRDSISAFGVRVGKKIMTCSFDVELKGRGIVPTPSSPIEFDSLLRACGLIASDAGAGGIAYNPTSEESEMASIALRFNLDDQQYLFTGAYGNVACNLVAGNFGILTFSFTGLYNVPSDVTQINPQFVNVTQPPIVENLGFTIDSYGGIAETLTFDFNNEISERPDLNSPEGLKGLRITNRAVAGTVNPEMVALSEKDFWSIFEASDKIAIVATVGSVAGNRFDISMPTVQIRNIGLGDRNGMRAYDIEFLAGGDDDEIKIVAY